MSCGVGMPSRDFASADLFSSRTMSMHNSTHSSQTNTVGPAMSLRTSCWLLPQNEQQSVLFEPPGPILLIACRKTPRMGHGALPSYRDVLEAEARSSRVR